jgi:4-aminobutyrate aminotransferase/(S)-3-amino-2-methylpropionate transaminase
MAHIKIKAPIPGPRSQELMRRRLQAVARGPFHSTPVFIQSASGALIQDVDGNTLIDLAAGIGVVNTGHAPARVSGAIQAQAQLFLHAGFNVTPYEGYVALAEKLNASVPGPGPKKTLLVNSGAEAVENAIKIARAHTKRPAVVCFDHAYHGRTYMAMTLTSKAKPYKSGFAPFCSDIYRAPYPYAYRWQGTQDPEEVACQAYGKFLEVVQSQIAVENLAAVILEPVLGEGGFVPAPVSFLKGLREFCTDNGVVLIFDEVQSGFGRTGSLYAADRLGVAPDLVTLAKGLGDGLPIAAVTGRGDIMDAPGEGGIGGTFGGNPLACAGALEVFELFRDGSLLAHAAQLEKRLEQRLGDWLGRFPIVGDTRGLGPMRGVELVKDRNTKEPDKAAVQKVLRHAYEHGVVCLSAGTYGNVIRFLPPLVITLEQLDEALDVIEAGIATL